MQTSKQMESKTEDARELNGGLHIKKMNKLIIDDCHYGLYKYHFDLDEMKKEVSKELYEGAMDIKNSLDNQEPISVHTYVRKFRSYNQILMIQDIITQLRVKDGPHYVNQLNTNRGLSTIYEIQLSQEFCERYTVPLAGVIKLEKLLVNGRGVEEFRGRIMQYDQDNYTVQFMLFRGSMPQGNHGYIVRFEPSRFVYNSRDHILKDVAKFEAQVGFLLFPQPIAENMVTRDSYQDQRRQMVASLNFASIHFNEEQREAIFAIVMAAKLRICNKKGFLLPYIIHGPPGTGKTTLLVEAIRQLMLVQESTNRILVCTPSNTAADLFASKLLEAHVDTSAIFRLYALMLPITEMPSNLKEISYICKSVDGDGLEMFAIHQKERLLQFQVIISTMMASTYLILGEMSGQFTHIIIDEAGQASELETMVPIAGLIGDKNQTKIVLAGDARQLGPMDTNQYFQKKGITKSLIERLEKVPSYKDDPRIMTFLPKNYRSHEAIIAVPSELFYNNELIKAPEGPPKDLLAQWKVLPKKGFPLFWHNIETPEARETNGTSYMNAGELAEIVKYVQLIITDLNVLPADIGIISPYAFQTRKLRHALEKEHPGITIDTVERFQGSQRRVIIVTTVRSNPNDRLGFMNSDKRFNTMITRAEELLVIVGNAKNMAFDKSWAKLIKYVLKNNAGIDFPPDFVGPDFPEGEMNDELSLPGKRQHASDDESNMASVDDDEEESEEEEEDSDEESSDEEDEEEDSDDKDEEAEAQSDDNDGEVKEDDEDEEEDDEEEEFEDGVEDEEANKEMESTTE